MKLDSNSREYLEESYVANAYICLTQAAFFRSAFMASYPGEIKIKETGENITFSKWLDPWLDNYPELEGSFCDKMLKEVYIEHALELHNIAGVFDDPIQNMAYAYLYMDLIDRDIFTAGSAIKDFYHLDEISLYYYILSILYRDFSNAINFVHEHSPNTNPFVYFDTIKQELAAGGYMAIGYWYANSQEVRGFVDREKKMQTHRSAGGLARAGLYRPKREVWQKQAEELGDKKPSMKKTEVARVVAKQTGDSFETIRKHIKNNDN